MWYFRWKEFEPESVWDYVLIPWWLARWGFLWVFCRLDCWLFPRRTRLRWWEPCICTRCFWTGPDAWACRFHNEWEWETECPRCGAMV